MKCSEYVLVSLTKIRIDLMNFNDFYECVAACHSDSHRSLEISIPEHVSETQVMIHSNCSKSMNTTGKAMRVSVHFRWPAFKRGKTQLFFSFFFRRQETKIKGFTVYVF